MRDEIAALLICIGIVFGALVSALVVSQQVKVIEKIVPSACPEIVIPSCPSLSCPRVSCPALVMPECTTLDYDKCLDVVKKARRIR